MSELFDHLTGRIKNQIVPYDYEEDVKYIIRDLGPIASAFEQYRGPEHVANADKADAKS